MEDKNSIHPQDGNQVVIGTNTGTIHIHNSSDTELLKQVLKYQNDQNESLARIVDIIKVTADFGMKMAEKSQTKRKK